MDRLQNKWEPRLNEFSKAHEGSILERFKSRQGRLRKGSLHFRRTVSPSVPGIVPMFAFSGPNKCARPFLKGSSIGAADVQIVGVKSSV